MKYFEVKTNLKNKNENYHDTLTKKVKTHLKLLQMDEDLSSNPVSYHSGKAVYISGASLYKERAAASEHIFLCRNLEKKCATASSYNYVHLINILK